MNAGAYVTGTQLRRLGEYYAKAIHDNFGLDFDVLFGPAYKGIPLSVATSMAISELYGKDVRYCSNRKEVKDHGDTGILLGSKLKDGDRVVMIEDAGYARETQYLLERLGVFCTYVTGTTRGQPHAWNLVRCDGNYYYVDTTWGDPVFLQTDGGSIPEEQQIQYDYLCCSEQELFRTHELDADVTFPSCTAVNDNYYVREGCYYQRFDQDRMQKQLNEEISSKEPVSVFKFSGQSAYEESRDRLMNGLIRDAASILAQQNGLSSARYYYKDDPVLCKINFYCHYE